MNYDGDGDDDDGGDDTVDDDDDDDESSEFYLCNHLAFPKRTSSLCLLRLPLRYKHNCMNGRLYNLNCLPQDCKIKF